MFKKILSFIIFLLAVFAAYLLYNALTYKSKQVNFDPVEKIVINDSAVHHLSKAVQIKTISTENPINFDSTEFEKFSKFLESSYPLINSHLNKTVINRYSLLYQI